MLCKYCGAEISDESIFCNKCGGKIIDENIEYNTEKKTFSITKKKNKSTICFVLVVVMLGVGIKVTVNYFQKENLKKQLLRDWSRVESHNETYYTLILDFSDDKIEYIFDSVFYKDTPIESFKYKIISPNEIEVSNCGLDYKEIHKIKFNDDKTMMTMTPALTKTASKEYWYSD